MSINNIPNYLYFYSKDGVFDVALRVNVLIYDTGRVEWLPPALYKSTCTIDVRLYYH